MNWMDERMWQMWLALTGVNSVEVILPLGDGRWIHRVFTR